MFGFSGSKLTRLYGWCEDTLWKAQSSSVLELLRQANDTKTSIRIAFLNAVLHKLSCNAVITVRDSQHARVNANQIASSSSNFPIIYSNTTRQQGPSFAGILQMCRSQSQHACMEKYLSLFPTKGHSATIVHLYMKNAPQKASKVCNLQCKKAHYVQPKIQSACSVVLV